MKFPEVRGEEIFMDLNASQLSSSLHTRSSTSTEYELNTGATLKTCTMGKVGLQPAAQPGKHPKLGVSQSPSPDEVFG